MYGSTMLSRLLESTDLPRLTRFAIVLWTSMQYEYKKIKIKDLKKFRWLVAHD